MNFLFFFWFFGRTVFPEVNINDDDINNDKDAKNDTADGEHLHH